LKLFQKRILDKILKIFRFSFGVRRIAFGINKGIVEKRLELINCEELLTIV